MINKNPDVRTRRKNIEKKFKFVLQFFFGGGEELYKFCYISELWSSKTVVRNFRTFECFKYISRYFMACKEFGDKLWKDFFASPLPNRNLTIRFLDSFS